MNALNNLSNYMHWLIRLQLAGIFIFHGFGKFADAAMMAQGMGMPVFMIYMLGMMEVGAGVLAVVGGAGPEWATKVSGAIIAVVMMGAIIMVHGPQWSFVANEAKPMGGMELQLLVLLIGLTLLTKGNAINRGASE